MIAPAGLALGPPQTELRWTCIHPLSPMSPRASCKDHKRRVLGSAVAGATSAIEAPPHAPSLAGGAIQPATTALVSHWGINDERPRVLDAHRMLPKRTPKPAGRENRIEGNPTKRSGRRKQKCKSAKERTQAANLDLGLIPPILVHRAPVNSTSNSRKTLTRSGTFTRWTRRESKKRRRGGKAA